MARTLTDDDLWAIAALLEPIQVGVGYLTTMCEQVDKGLPTEHSRWQASALEMAPGLSPQDVRDAMQLAPSGDDPEAESVDAHLDDLLSALTTLDGLVDAIKERTDRLGTGVVVAVAPVATSGDVAIDRGYDYYAADGRALRWVDDAQPTWPNLTGATATFYCGGLAVAGTISNPTGPATIAVQLSRAQTAQLRPGTRPLHVDVTLANGHVILQIRGMATVR